MATFRCIKAALVDLNGTLHVADQEVAGSIDALKQLRQAGISVRFVSNTTKDTTANLLNLVRRIGFTVEDGEVFTSIAACRALVASRGLHPMLLLQPQALPEFGGLAAEAVGSSGSDGAGGDGCWGGNAGIVSSGSGGTLQQYGGGAAQPYDAVVVGLAKQVFSFENMNQAFRVLLDNPAAPLIAIHKGRYCKEKDGSLSLGPGPFVAALEYATGRTSEVVGKPEASFFRLALDDLGAEAGDAVMVGDDVRDDVGGAQRAGLRGILVQTGKYRPGDESSQGVMPDAVVPDFARAVDFILENNARAATIGG